MGTSISHRSPNTPNWHAAVSTYRSEAFGADRVIQEIWRAATNQPSGDLGVDLTSPIVGRCLGIALHATSAEQAYNDSSRMIALSGVSNLATDIAKRAVVGSFLKTESRASNFVSSLFVESVNYLISRDLPSYVGTGERIRNASSTLDFKKTIKDEVENIVRRIALPSGIESNPHTWRAFVDTVILSLAGK